MYVILTLHRYFDPFFLYGVWVWLACSRELFPFLSISQRYMYSLRELGRAWVWLARLYLSSHLSPDASISSIFRSILSLFDAQRVTRMVWLAFESFLSSFLFFLCSELYV